MPDVKTVVVCTGGGGLLAGIAVAVKALRPDVRVVGVQAEDAAAYPASLAAGKPVPLDAMATMADGIAVGCPGDVPFEHRAATSSTTSYTVSEESLSRALLLCLERAKLVVEPAGAAGVAALLDDPTAFEPPVVVVLSGGNIDPLLLQRVLRHGLAVAGRFLSFRARISDRPGALVRLLAEVADGRRQRARGRARAHRRAAARRRGRGRAAARDPRCRALRRGARPAARGRLHRSSSASRTA